MSAPDQPIPLWKEILRVPSLVLGLVGLIVAAAPAALQQDRIAGHLVEIAREQQVQRVNVALGQIDVALDIAERSAARFADALSVLPVETPDAFETRYARGEDGFWRTPKDSFNAQRHAGVWIPAGVELTAADRGWFVAADRFTSLYGLGSYNPFFVSTWVLPLTNGEIVFFPNNANFIYDAGPETDYRSTEWVTLTEPALNPAGEPRWTRVSFDPLAKAWMVSVVAPFKREGRWAGSAGHDVLLDSLFSALSAASDATNGYNQHADLLWIADVTGRVVPVVPSASGARVSPEAFLGKSPLALIAGVMDRTVAAGRDFATEVHQQEDETLLIGVIPRLQVAVAYRMHNESLRALVDKDIRQIQLAQVSLLLVILIGMATVFSQTLRQRRSRTELVEMKNAELERLVDERTRELQDANEQLEAQNLRDPLTGLGNRRHFDQALATLWATCGRRNEPFTLLLIDVDHFKKYNDHYGHPTGDSCLRTVGMLLGAQAQRADDLAARYGGEEFALLLPCTDTPGALAIANAIRQLLIIEALPHAGSPFGRVTVSIGIATVIPEGPATEADRLVNLADEALYAAKESGRDRAVCASPQT